MTGPRTEVPRLCPPPGSRVVVVGGCGGMGRAFVAAALEARLQIAVLDLPRSLAEHPVPDGVQAVACDATDEQSVAAAFAAVADRWPAVDAAVNLVGFTTTRLPVEELPTAVWDEVTAGSLRSAYLVSRAAIPLLRRGEQPALVHTSSTFGVAVRHAGYAPYAAAKAAVINLVRALAVECGPDIRVNALAPGLTDTQFIRGGTGREQRATQLDSAAIGAALPLRRIAEATDMVGPLMFLIGPASGYVTAQTLHVNGGMWS